MTDGRDPRILICRLSAIGDCIATMPVLCALRKQFPGAMLGWVAEPAAATLLRGHHCLDELIVAPKGWLKSPRCVRRLRDQLRAFRPDITVDPQSLTKSALLAWFSGAPRRIGFQRPRGREFSRFLNNQLITPAASHLVDAQLELLQVLGIDRPDVQFAVPRDEADECLMDQFLRAHHFSGTFAVINVGAGWNSRLWPPGRYGRVAKHLGRARSVPTLVVWSGERERNWAQEVVAGSGGHGVLAPTTSLTQLAAVFRRASLYVGSDTGPMHLASAVGTTCTVLFGTTRPNESGPYGPKHVCVQHRYQSGSSRQRRRAANDAMLEINVEMVCEACDIALDRRQAMQAA